MGAGRKRTEVCMADNFCTSWKKSVRYVSIALKTPHVMKTPMQTTLKMRFRQREFGMMAGRPSLSCRPTQSMNPGIRHIAVIRRPRVVGSRILPVSSEIRLHVM
jgi:hypothetical protein